MRIEAPDGPFSVTLLDVPANHKAVLRITGLWRTMLRTCGLRKPVLLNLPSGDLRIDGKVFHVQSRATLGFDAPKEWTISHERLHSQTSARSASAATLPASNAR